MNELAILGGDINPSTLSVSKLRDFRGNFCGIRIPGSRYQNGLIFTPSYPSYSVTERRDIRKHYRAAGYTHFPISLYPSGIYHDLYPYWDGKNVNLLLHELYNDGLIPVCFEFDDDFNSNPAVDTSLVRIVLPQWEMNGPCHDDTDLINKTILATRSRYPAALLYVHFTPGHAAGGEPETDWWFWARDVAKVRGICYQHGNDVDAQGCYDRCVDFLVRFAGYHGWPIGLDFVLFEFLAYPVFWGQVDNVIASETNGKVLAKGPGSITENGVTYTGDFAGYCNGK